MFHLTLLGDSIFDNRAYVGENGKDVITHLEDIVPQNWKVKLEAVDGSLARDVNSQLQEIESEATHFFVSAGGNNAIMNSDILALELNSSAELFASLAYRIDIFENQYVEMLKNILKRNVSTTVCTIYYPNINDELMQKLSITALSSFNDIIIKQATLAGIPIIDLRFVCNEKDDYANEIEPSDKGGKKIAEKILEVARDHDFSSRRTTIYY